MVEAMYLLLMGSELGVPLSHGPMRIRWDELEEWTL